MNATRPSLAAQRAQDEVDGLRDGAAAAHHQLDVEAREAPVSGELDGAAQVRLDVLGVPAPRRLPQQVADDLVPIDAAGGQRSVGDVQHPAVGAQERDEARRLRVRHLTPSGAGPRDRPPDRTPRPGALAARVARPMTRARDRAVLASLWVVSFPCAGNHRAESRSFGSEEPTVARRRGGENLGSPLTTGIGAPSRRGRMPFMRALKPRRLASRNERDAATEPCPRSWDAATGL